MLVALGYRDHNKSRVALLKAKRQRRTSDTPLRGGWRGISGTTTVVLPKISQGFYTGLESVGCEFGISKTLCARPDTGTE
jgi:hypothetical protein